MRGSLSSETVLLPSDPGPRTYRYSPPYCWPAVEYQSCMKVASWLRLIAQKKALLIEWPRTVELP